MTAADAGKFLQYLELCKPRVVSLIVFTAVVGMFLSVPGWPPLVALLAGTAGIGLAASSAAAINHLLDQRIDAKSILGILLLAASKGTELRFTFSGPDEEEAGCRRWPCVGLLSR